MSIRRKQQGLRDLNWNCLAAWALPCHQSTPFCVPVYSNWPQPRKMQKLCCLGRPTARPCVVHASSTCVSLWNFHGWHYREELHRKQLTLWLAESRNVVTMNCCASRFYSLQVTKKYICKFAETEISFWRNFYYQLHRKATSRAVSDENFIKISKFPFQCSCKFHHTNIPCRPCSCVHCGHVYSYKWNSQYTSSM